MIRRSKKLIQPALQLRIAAVFLITAAVAVLVQAGVLTWVLSDLSFSVPDDGEQIRAAIPRILVTSLFISFAVLVPSMLLIGVLSTFRFLGPLHRMQEHLKALIRGENPGPCTVREGDELHELCSLLNQAVEPVRTTVPVATATEPEKQLLEAA